MLLEARGSLVVRRLCHLLGAERVYRRLAQILDQEENLRFTGVMVQALNLIVLTAAEARAVTPQDSLLPPRLAPHLHLLRMLSRPS